MGNPSLTVSGFDPEQVNDIEKLTPDMDSATSEKVKRFLDQSGDQPYIHRNEGYLVVVTMTGELEATDALRDYLRKRAQLRYSM